MNVWTMLIFNWAEWRFLFRFLIPHWIWVLFFGMVRFLWAVLFYWKRKFVLCRWLKIFFLLVIGIEFLCQKWMAQTGTFFHDFLIFDIFQLIFWNYYIKKIDPEGVPCGIKNFFVADLLKNSSDCPISSTFFSSKATQNIFF